MAERLSEARVSDDVGPPGQWICRTCGFVLMKMKLRASDMAVGVDARPVEDICPNDGSSMRPKTWKEDALDSDRVGREQMARADAAEREIERLRGERDEARQQRDHAKADVEQGFVRIAALKHDVSELQIELQAETDVQREVEKQLRRQIATLTAERDETKQIQAMWKDAYTAARETAIQVEQERDEASAQADTAESALTALQGACERLKVLIETRQLGRAMEVLTNALTAPPVPSETQTTAAVPFDPNNNTVPIQQASYVDERGQPFGRCRCALCVEINARVP